MRFALIGNNRVEAKPELTEGVCPACSQPVIAKCGEKRIHHWAHRANKMCDGWWESETEWHRSWKNKFPDEWQEIILPDEQTGEKHIADIRTDRGFVIEFQHSSINPQERSSREMFYKNMVWVVDGTRLKRDHPRFLKGKSNLCLTDTQGFFLAHFPDEVFPAAWLESSVPVIFDFSGVTGIDPQDTTCDTLWCLFPEKFNGQPVVAAITRGDFAAGIRSHPQSFYWSRQVDKICDTWREPETEWHRFWKNSFPDEWREVLLRDERTGEKHIVDIYTRHGLVIEFRHFPLNPQEISLREKFYKNIIWVVNGIGMNCDYQRFLKESGRFRRVSPEPFFLIDSPEKYFSAAWLKSSAPVVFDFSGGQPSGNQQDKGQYVLCCLLPGRAGNFAVAAAMPRDYFVNTVLNNSQLLPYREIVYKVRDALRQEQIERERRQQMLKGIGRRRPRL